MAGWGSGGWGSMAWGGATALPLEILTVALPGAENGTPYSQTLLASGGTPPYTWTVISGSLPTGLSLSSAGVLSGTPTVNGTSNFTIRVTDSVSATASRAYSMTVVSPPIPLQITTSSLAPSTLGEAYSATLVAAGGSPPYTWSVVAGRLPAGLVLSTDGVISGVQLDDVSQGFTVRVTDSVLDTGDQAFLIVVISALSLISFFLPPMRRVYPRDPALRGLWRMAWHLTGAVHALIVAGSTYIGGRWNGPLSAEQKQSLTEAGYGARIVEVAHPGQLPPGLDEPLLVS